MPRPRFLDAATTSPPQPPHNLGILSINSDFLVIVTALLCALICVVGLVAIPRCPWMRPFSGRNDEPLGLTSPLPGNKGLKKKILKSLPKIVYGSGDGSEDQCGLDCAICLAEFVVGDEIRLLPECGHTFHVGCIDKWFGSHSSCPTCRRVLGSPQCEKCGEAPVVMPASLDVRVEAPEVSSGS